MDTWSKLRTLHGPCPGYKKKLTLIIKFTGSRCPPWSSFPYTQVLFHLVSLNTNNIIYCSWTTNPYQSYYQRGVLTIPFLTPQGKFPSVLFVNNFKWSPLLYSPIPAIPSHKILFKFMLCNSKWWYLLTNTCITIRTGESTRAAFLYKLWSEYPSLAVENRRLHLFP